GAWAHAQAQDLPRLPMKKTPEGVEYHPSHVLVRFRVGTTASTLATARALVDTRTFDSYSLVPGLEGLHGGSIYVESAIQVLRALPSVLYAEPDYIVHALNTPNDQFFNQEWGLNNTGQTIQGSVGVADADIDAPEGWDVTTGNPNFVIAIIDTGTQWS